MNACFCPKNVYDIYNIQENHVPGMSGNPDQTIITIDSKVPYW